MGKSEVYIGKAALYKRAVSVCRSELPPVESMSYSHENGMEILAGKNIRLCSTKKGNWIKLEMFGSEARGSSKTIQTYSDWNGKTFGYKGAIEQADDSVPSEAG